MKTQTTNNKRLASITQKMTGEYFAYDNTQEFIDERATGYDTRRQLIAELKRRAEFDREDDQYTHYKTPAGRIVKL